MLFIWCSTSDMMDLLFCMLERGDLGQAVYLDLSGRLASLARYNKTESPASFYSVGSFRKLRVFRAILLLRDSILSLQRGREVYEVCVLNFCWF